MPLSLINTTHVYCVGCKLSIDVGVQLLSSSSSTAPTCVSWMRGRKWNSQFKICMAVHSNVISVCWLGKHFMIWPHLSATAWLPFRAAWVSIAKFRHAKTVRWEIISLMRWHKSTGNDSIRFCKSQVKTLHMTRYVFMNLLYFFHWSSANFSWRFAQKSIYTKFHYKIKIIGYLTGKGYTHCGFKIYFYSIL